MNNVCRVQNQIGIFFMVAQEKNGHKNELFLHGFGLVTIRGFLLFLAFGVFWHFCNLIKSPIWGTADSDY